MIAWLIWAVAMGIAIWLVVEHIRWEREFNRECDASAEHFKRVMAGHQPILSSGDVIPPQREP